MVSEVGSRFPLEWENEGTSSYILFLTAECWLNTCVQFVKIHSAGHLVYGHFSVCMLSSMKKPFFKARTDGVGFIQVRSDASLS